MTDEEFMIGVRERLTDNERLHFIDNDTKTTRVYCENYEVKNDG